MGNFLLFYFINDKQVEVHIFDSLIYFTLPINFLKNLTNHVNLGT